VEAQTPRTWPRWWRWAAALWLLVWVPVYAATWGWRNFFAICDVAAALTCLGLMVRSPLLLGGQTLAALIPGVLWAADVAARLATGRHLFGGTEYMWMAGVPLTVRLLSLFHLALPVLLLLILRRVGYDRRALVFQAALMIPLLVLTRLIVPAEKNLNYAFHAPFGNFTFGPAPLHLAVAWLVFVLLIFLPTHLLLTRVFHPSKG
jgi:hypothetical protein